ncbi:hypothetical protein [Vibrio phage RYC]|nr:hypothetical protein [Vibrio phage RYC]
MYIDTRFQDFYDWSFCVSHDKSDVHYNREFSTRSIESETFRDLNDRRQALIVLIGGVAFSFHPRNEGRTWYRSYGLFGASYENLKEMHTDEEIAYNILGQERHPFNNSPYAEEYHCYRIQEDKCWMADGEMGSKSRTAITGKLLISKPLLDWFSSESVVETGCAESYRKALDIEAPVALILTDRYQTKLCNIYENFSFMNSGLSNLWCFNNVDEIASYIDSYVSLMYDVDTVEVGNEDKIVGQGFDLKQSFRTRK